MSLEVCVDAVYRMRYPAARVDVAAPDAEGLALPDVAAVPGAHAATRQHRRMTPGKQTDGNRLFGFRLRRLYRVDGDYTADFGRSTYRAQLRALSYVPEGVPTKLRCTRWRGYAKEKRALPQSAAARPDANRVCAGRPGPVLTDHGRARWSPAHVQRRDRPLRGSGGFAIGGTARQCQHNRHPGADRDSQHR